MDARGYLSTKGKVKPYFSLAPCVGIVAFAESTFYVHTGLGFDYKRFNMEAGYRHWLFADDAYSVIEHQVYLKFGVRIGK